jgi:hypothetical protein
MPVDTIERVRALLQERKSEISAELRQVEQALAGLRAGGRSPGAGGGTATRQRARSRTGGRRGQRAEQFLGALKEKPGSGVSEVAKRIGISPQQGYGIAKRLRERGQIKKQGKGYAVKG